MIDENHDQGQAAKEVNSQIPLAVSAHISPEST
jgi:hypothetical protein